MAIFKDVMQKLHTVPLRRAKSVVAFTQPADRQWSATGGGGGEALDSLKN